MKHSRKPWARTSVAAFAGLALAATAAFGYERPDETARATVVAEAEQADMGIDFIITGPVGRSKIERVAPTPSPAKAQRTPVRHRMRAR